MIKTESELPQNYEIISKPGSVAYDESMMQKIIVLDVGVNETNKVCWVLIVSDKKDTVHTLQYINKLTKNHQYKIAKKDLIDKGLLDFLYNKEDQSGKVNEETSEYIQYIDNLLDLSLREKVSDIHIEKREDKGYIKMRKHGDLNTLRELSPAFTRDMCSVMYNVLAEDKDVVFNETSYQSCAINRVIGNQEVKLRYQSLPVYPGGFDIVLRVLPIGKDESFTPLSELGYTPNQISVLTDIVAKPVGGLIIAGTTGSGKSTTLKNLIMHIHKEGDYKDKIFTIEDPPEYRIPRVSQIPVIRRKDDDYSKKSPFEAPLTACMRADPDILMIGEVRDKVTGDGLKKAIQSGHQVLTTIHAGSALAIIERLLDFGLDRGVLGSNEFLNGLLYQKLLPLLCPECSLPFNELIANSNVKESDMFLYNRLLSVLDIEKDVIKVRNPHPENCPKCKGMGITGRTVCAEIVMPDFGLLEYFSKGDNIGALRYWRDLSDGDKNSTDMTGKTAMEHALLKMRQGLISPHDIEKSFGLIGGDPTSKLYNKNKNKTDEKVSTKKDDGWINIDFDNLS